jgi:Mg/Co/Ni transporter MgtE
MQAFGLRRLGLDPASASAPLVARVVDVTGVGIDFRWREPSWRCVTG